MSEGAVTVRRPLAPEDEARAEFYALLAGLFARRARRFAPRGDCRRTVPARPRRTLRTTQGDTLAGAWERLRGASAAMDPEAAARRVPDALRRRGPKRGESLRLALPRSPIRAPARGDPRVAGGTRARSSSRIERIRGSSLDGSRNHANAGRGRRRATAGVHCGAAGLFRPARRAVGAGMLRCNNVRIQLPTTIGR